MPGRLQVVTYLDPARYFLDHRAGPVPQGDARRRRVPPALAAGADRLRRRLPRRPGCSAPDGVTPMPRLSLLALPARCSAACTVGPGHHAPAADRGEHGAVARTRRPALIDLALVGPASATRSFRRWCARAGRAAPDSRGSRGALAEARANRDAVAGRAPADAWTAKGSATENVLSENGQIADRQHPRLRPRVPAVRSGLRRELGGRSCGAANARQIEAANARAEAARSPGAM